MSNKTDKFSKSAASSISAKCVKHTLDSMRLPSPVQKWSHSTCSVASLEEALSNSSITAIETDIVLGKDSSSLGANNAIEPITAHPPNRESDLTLKKFFEMTTQMGNGKKGTLKKHIKLDFKEYEALHRTVEAILEMKNVDQNGKTIFLNADVLPGPGLRLELPTIHGDAFLKTCLEIMKKSHLNFSFSFGWKVDCRSLTGYNKNDVAAMESLIDRHELRSRCGGIVLAVNARIISKSCAVFKSFLADFPHSQLLVWTGTGEPPISQRQINGIKRYFDKIGAGNRIGFDCVVASNYITGLFYDIALWLVSIYWNAARLTKNLKQSL